ncbi:aldehyde dehydrogenase family protein [Methylocapsa sp. S129]|uniref:aldehyde dehydrogenase family protein n=1 Tax=Methylocapsa sp. S129 TaxID=1641869 RepID=UPI00131E03F0|nr:aldehyde dehydrogenase family protein [Methylocapsa sp. S129]
MAQPAPVEQFAFGHLDQAIAELQANKNAWARTSVEERLSILADIKKALMNVAESWALTAARKKQIPAGSPLAGEEWISGPYALMSGCNALIQTLSGMKDKTFLQGLPVRDLANGRIAVSVVPNSLWDRLLLSGVKAEIWMQAGVTKDNLASHTAGAYDVPPEKREGKVALVLGAGNIAAIAPLDCFQKLFSEHQATILKLNPVNDYLIDVLEAALKPLIARGALRIVKGGADAGEYLCNHPGVDEIHITGAEASHDVIVWGPGEEGRRNKQAGAPRNRRPITSELGAVCPTIVVPGPWSAADLSFQAEHIATQKMHNSGFNCIACQMLIAPERWEGTAPLLQKIEATIKAMPPRAPYYPGATRRMSDFSDRGHDAANPAPANDSSCVVVPFVRDGDAWFETNEVFAPAMSVRRIDETDPEAFLRAAIAYANTRLRGTLGANILIHPATMRKIGRKTFEAILVDLRYGCIAINAWSGLGFLLVKTPWGAFPGHTLDDAQSGIGFVHNTFMFDKPERTVVEAPFRPYPRNLLSGEMSLLPRPPWFVTNRKQHVIGKLLTSFEYRPSWLKIPQIFLNALMG